MVMKLQLDQRQQTKRKC